MSGKRISELSELVSFEAADKLAVVDDSETDIDDKTKAATYGLLFDSINNANTKYFGDPMTDGSFRIILDSGSLKFQKRVSGVWEDRDVIAD
jgi:hypothetical protein